MLVPAAILLAVTGLWYHRPRSLTLVATCFPHLQNLHLLSGPPPSFWDCFFLSGPCLLAPALPSGSQAPSFSGLNSVCSEAQQQVINLLVGPSQVSLLVGGFKMHQSCLIQVLSDFQAAHTGCSYQEAGSRWRVREFSFGHWPVYVDTAICCLFPLHNVSWFLQWLQVSNPPSVPCGLWFYPWTRHQKEQNRVFQRHILTSLIMWLIYVGFA